ncbi:MAG: MBL fold metallo-hydrolase [Mycobacterium kyogaense]|uniref:MBL fold metallo-hydrolase n=1 Tax=Mycobacterium kyogaense TaxID=2212479 RepID=UPI002FF4E841
MRPLPVSASWFVVTDCGAGVTLIEEPGVEPMLRANTWYVRGRRRDVVIDTGLGVCSLRDALAETFGGREPVAVLTHSHPDHMGGAHEFRQRWAHPAENPGRPAHVSLFGPDLCAALGVDPGTDGMSGWQLNAVPSDDYDMSTYQTRPAPTTADLRDGDVVDLGDRRLEVLHLPGHSPGSIALYDPDTRTLFSGDVVYDAELLDDLVGSDRAHYRESMRRLAQLDVATVHAGHEPSFDGDRLHVLIDAYLSTPTPESTRI